MDASVTEWDPEHDPEEGVSSQLCHHVGKLEIGLL
jgi:hypothetical protein